MKKENLIQWYCPECGSIHVQQKAWVGLNSSEIDWEGSEDLCEYYCQDCESTFDRIDSKIFKCHNGKPRIQGYQVVANGENGVEMYPSMDASFCLYSLSQAKEMLNESVELPTGNCEWKLLTCFKGDIDEPTLMFKGDPRQ